MGRIAVFYFVFLLTFTHLFAQTGINQNDAKAINSISEYFKLDRENIHLHLNKSIFLSEESIWFKGYVIEKKTSLPYEATTNVFVQLLDGQGRVLSTQLIYAENSTFKGSLKLSKELKSGDYYLRAFTNYMNNFLEDESTIHAISVVNPLDNNYTDPGKIDFASARITFFPESGVFLEGITNTIGVRIEDCHGNGVAVTAGEVLDARGNVINNFSTDSHGCGKFDIVSTSNEQYSAVCTIDSKKVAKNLPLPVLNGVALSVNNYALPNKTIVKVKTNSRTAANVQYKLIIHKNGLASIADVSMDGKTEITMAIPNDKLSDGINTLYLTDKEFTRLAERIIFTPGMLGSPIDIEVVRKTKDSIFFSGKSGIKMGEISASALPVNSISDVSHSSIYGSLLFNNNFSSPSEDFSYYLTDFSRKKHYELDNLLLTKTSRYQLESMLKTPPVERFEFDSGLTVKGSVNADISDNADYRVKMQSLLLGVDAYSVLNEKNEFYFKNIFATDSTKLHFSLLNKKSKIEQIKMQSQIVNGNRTLKHLFPIVPACDFENIPRGNNVNDNFLFPKMKDVIALDTIQIAGRKKKTDAEKNTRRRNGMADARKLTDADRAGHRDVLSYIQFHGYSVSYLNGGVQIKSNLNNTFRGTTSPQIYVDDVPISDFSYFLGMMLDNIDEISINKFGFGGGSGSSNGIIRIYTKLISDGGISNVVVKSQPLLVLKGFQNEVSYINPEFDNYKDAGFTNFGTIHWSPKIATDENGGFQLSIPNFGQKSVKFLLDGISSDGQMASKTITVLIP